MNEQKPGAVPGYAWREAFLRRLSDGLIVASAVSMAVISIAAASETISTATTAGIVLMLYVLSIVVAACACLCGFLSTRRAKASRTDCDISTNRMHGGD